MRADNKKVLKMLHLPTAVGGNPISLSKSFSRLGIKSSTAVLDKNYLDYGADIVICGAGSSKLIKEIKKIIFLSYVFRYDIIFMNFGTGLFNPYPIFGVSNTKIYKRILRHLYSQYSYLMASLEFFLIKKLNRVLLIQFQGDDARQGNFLKENYSISHITEVDISYYNNRSDTLKKKNIEFISKRCEHIYALNPDLMWLLPKKSKFLPYANVQISEISKTRIEKTPNDRLVIVHAPTHRAVKGTKYIITAINQLKAAGYDFEFILVENMTNSEALNVYRRADLLIDQILVGWYGGVAVEAMALGVPPMAYIREQDIAHVSQHMLSDMPVINVTPDTLFDELKKFCHLSFSERRALSAQCVSFVRRWHDPDTICQKIINDINIKRLNF